MKTFKLIDICISILLIILLTVWILAPYRGTDRLEKLILSYITAGAWQSLSMIIHECTGWFVRGAGTRRWYHLISLLLLITIPLGSMYLLCFIAAPMAVFYTGLCIYELKVKTKRPLSVLK